MLYDIQTIYWTLVLAAILALIYFLAPAAAVGTTVYQRNPNTYAACIARCERARPYISEVMYARCVYDCRDIYGR